MIDLSQIESLYNTHQQISVYAIIIFAIGVVITISLFVYHDRKNDYSNRAGIIGLTPMLVGAALMLSILILFASSSQISTMIEDYFKQMSCDELRLEIKHLITTRDNDFIDRIKQHQQFAEDLYYYSCEVPLRDEVLKLQ